MTKNWRDGILIVARTPHALTLSAYDLAPFMNVALMLVMFALMVSGFVYQPGIEVDVPLVHNPDAIRGRTLALTITKEEQVYLADSPQPLVLREAIVAHLRDFYRRHPDGVVVLRADAAVRHGFLLQMLELIRDTGLRRISFAGALPPDAQTTPRVE